MSTAKMGKPPSLSATPIFFHSVDSVKARLHYQWPPVVLKYGNGEHVENDGVDANCSRLHYHFPRARCYHTQKTTGAH